MRQLISRCLLICLILTADYAAADAIVRSNAMFADTIAEYFIDDDQVRLELEIGANDVAAFRNLLPDALYRELGFGDESLRERVTKFVTEDMPIAVDGVRIAGRLIDIGPATRPLRDNITGEELPTPDEDAVVVIRATIEYPIAQLPAGITLVAPAETGPANIGFVVYHKGVAVNDYRYLVSGQTVQLDWEDPWYSAFPERGMRRQYYSPMTGFIYVEPYEVRKEIIVRPADIQRFVDLGLVGEAVIPAERHDEIKQRVVEFLAGHFPLKIDGEIVQADVDRVNFLRRTLRSSVVVDNQDLALLPATLGVIYVVPTDGLPQLVEMEWDLFTERTPTIPAATVDQAGPLPTVLEPDFNVLRWENFLRFPDIPTLAEIESPPSTFQRTAGIAAWITTLISVFLLAMLLRNYFATRTLSKAAAIASTVTFAFMLLLHQQARDSRLDEERIVVLVGDLLHNVYRAFDYRGEEVIYDVLDKSVSGELLTEIYLETQKGLELANQGGARVKVKDTEVTGVELQGRDGNTLTVRGSWNVAGSVGHWGHVHQRVNAYQAVLEISEIDGAWKLTGLEILDEQRL